MDLEDILMYVALASFAIMSALYIATIQTFFNLEEIMAGRMQPYASLQHDLVVMLKEFFVVQFFFWLTLWAVKWSLLFMFKRLTEGLQLYNRIWWATFVLSVLLFLGCCISNFTSCSSMHAWFTAGECTTPRDARAKNISLWFSLAADLGSDLLSEIPYSPIERLADHRSNGHSCARTLDSQHVDRGEDQCCHRFHGWSHHNGHSNHTKCLSRVQCKFRPGQYDMAYAGT